MRIIVFYSAVSGYEQRLDSVLSLIRGTFEELDCEDFQVYNLEALAVKPYNGKISGFFESLGAELPKYDGVVFLSACDAFSVNSMTVGFLEHLSRLRLPLADKSCFIVTSSLTGGARRGAEALSRQIAELGGIEAVRAVIDRAAVTEYDEADFREIIERHTEDFYRAIRSNRKFFRPYHGARAEPRSSRPQNAEAAPPAARPDSAAKGGIDRLLDPSYDDSNDTLSSEQLLALLGERDAAPSAPVKRSAPPPPIREKPVASAGAREIASKYSANMTTEAQEQDVRELTEFFAKKFSAKEDSLIPIGESPLPISYADKAPREKTCRQYTQSMPHYFKPQLTDGLVFTLQLYISGIGGFEGFLKISEGGCSYFDGTSEIADITIMAEAKPWLEVLRGKNTAQKAFMIGKLKVRGNFMLLSKFDTIFSFPIG